MSARCFSYRAPVSSQDMDTSQDLPVADTLAGIHNRR